MSKYVEVYEGVNVPDTASHVKTVGQMLFYRIINDRLEYYSYANGEWKISEGVLKDVVELPLAEPAIDWNEAPEWATCVARADWVDKVAWCSSVAYLYVGDIYEHLIRENNIFTLIEMRPEPAAWMPEVGQFCEVESDVRNDWRKAMYVGVDSIGSHVFDVEKRNLWRIDSINILVRPLKTEAEKKREHNYNEILKMLNLIHVSDFNPIEAASVLAHGGFTAPEGDQS